MAQQTVKRFIILLRFFSARRSHSKLSENLFDGFNNDAFGKSALDCSCADFLKNRKHDQSVFLAWHQQIVSVAEDFRKVKLASCS